MVYKENVKNMRKRKEKEAYNPHPQKNGRHTSYPCIDRRFGKKEEAAFASIRGHDSPKTPNRTKPTNRPLHFLFTHVMTNRRFPSLIHPPSFLQFSLLRKTLNPRKKTAPHHQRTSKEASRGQRRPCRRP